MSCHPSWQHGAPNWTSSESVAPSLAQAVQSGLTCVQPPVSVWVCHQLMNQSVSHSSNQSFTQSHATHSNTPIHCTHPHTYARWSTKLKCISVKARTNGVKLPHGSWDKGGYKFTGCRLFSIQNFVQTKYSGSKRQRQLYPDGAVLHRPCLADGFETWACLSSSLSQTAHCDEDFVTLPNSCAVGNPAKSKLNQPVYVQHK